MLLATEACTSHEYLRRDSNPLDECAARRTGTGVSPVNAQIVRQLNSKPFFFW
jgi:hypothetical protein